MIEKAYPSSARNPRGLTRTRNLNNLGYRAISASILMAASALVFTACSGIPDLGDATKDDLLREKLESCASEWTSDASESDATVAALDPNVLVTTTMEGECLVGFAGDTSGYIPNQIFERSRSGSWYPFVNPAFIDSGDAAEFEKRVLIAEDLEAERKASPNAYIANSTQREISLEHPQVKLNPEATLPRSAKLYPSLLIAPQEKECGAAVTYGVADLPDPSIEPFEVQVVSASGISCRKVSKLIRRDFPLLVANQAGPWVEGLKEAFALRFLGRLDPREADSVDYWDCEGNRRLTCERGSEVSFKVAGKPLIPVRDVVPSSIPELAEVIRGFYSAGQALSPTFSKVDDEKVPRGGDAVCGAIDFGLGTSDGFSNISVEGIGCKEAVELLTTWLKTPDGNPPAGLACERGTPTGGSSPVRCEVGQAIIDFIWY